MSSVLAKPQANYRHSFVNGSQIYCRRHYTKELLWLQAFLQELGYILIFPIIINYDNQSCITLSANPKYHDQSKHINLQFHFLREKVQANILKLQYTSTSTMWANILTKSLTKDKY